MTITFLIAVFLVPFMAEWFAAPQRDSSTAKRNTLFYVLVPVMGLVIYTGAVVITGRTGLGLVGSLLFYGGLTAISNKKHEILKSPFNAHDFDNLRNLYIYPEFYISYVGWPILLLVGLLFLGLISLAVNIEAPLALYSYFPTYTGWAIVLIGWLFLIKFLRRRAYPYMNESKADKLGVSFDLASDIEHLGLFPTVFLYRLFIKYPCEKDNLRARLLSIHKETDEAPATDIIAIQGESYFDLRRLFKLVPTDNAGDWPILTELEKAGVQTGRLQVPAWGAYTMQTEFSFLTGIKNADLGVDRINPYMRFAQAPLCTLVRALKEAGYRTVCVHPAKKDFFRRAQVIPNLGFDEFIGLEAFQGAHYYGKYIADSALADEIEEIIQGHHALRSGPIFVFAITIESHGPWSAGRLAGHLDERALAAENPTGDLAFALYQKHMENLLTFYKRLSVGAGKTALLKPRVTALYGDHMPALGALFDACNLTDENVDYLLWTNNENTASKGKQSIETFGKTILKAANLHLKS